MYSVHQGRRQGRSQHLLTDWPIRQLGLKETRALKMAAILGFIQRQFLAFLM